jgi:uncharacterized membrane protein
MAEARSQTIEAMGGGELTLRHGLYARSARAERTARLRPLALTRSHPWVVVFGLALAGLGLRLLMVRGIWVDEAISVHQAHMSIGALLQDLRRTDNHPPLYFLALWGAVRLAGYSELAVRGPSIVAGVAIVPALFLAGRELFDRRTGLVAAALGACAPLVVWYSQEARMYAFFMLLATLSVFAQVRAVRDERVRWWVLYAALTIALIYTHYFSTILIALQQLAFAAVAWRRARHGQPIQRLMTGVALTWLAVTLAVLPLAAGFTAQQVVHDQQVGTGLSEATGAAGAPPGSAASSYALLTNLVWAIWGYHSDSAMISIGALWPLLMLGALALLGRRRSSTLLLTAVLALVPVFVLMVISASKASLFDVRYFAGSIPMLLLLCARALTGGALRRTPALVVTVALIASMLVGLADEQLNGSNPRTYDLKGALAQIRHQARYGDTVVYAPDYLNAVIEYYAPHLRAVAARGPHPYVPPTGGVYLLSSFLDQPGVAGEVGTAQYALSHSGRHLVAIHRLTKINIWEYR